MTRREFAMVLAGRAAATGAEPLIDIHQHVYYHERSDADLIAHQRGLGVTQTVLLPAGSQYGLAAECAGNEAVASFVAAHRGEFVAFANEMPDAHDARAVIERHLKNGALGIGEQKFPVGIDSPEIDLIASIAREFRVPVLMHFEHGSYNTGFEKLERLLQRYPGVNFIGHAQTWWANISTDADPGVLYPKGRVKRGGLTDRLLSDYSNLWGDLSAGSGLNAFTRDEEHARGFLDRHQDRLMYGSDCADSAPGTEACSGWLMLKAVRRLASAAVRRKVLHGNAERLLGL